MSKIIHLADLHLSSRPEDEYRFRCLDWLASNVDRFDAWAILGDLTEEYDGHNSVLVNEIANRLALIANVRPGYIIVGNHDYVDAHRPFFGFLRHVKNIEFITQPMILDMPGEKPTKALALPNVKKPETLAEQVERQAKRGERIDLVWTHQCFAGAISESGNELEGFDAKEIFKPVRRMSPIILAGDIHNPHTVSSGNVQYIGSPHPVDYGDHFDPQAIGYDSERDQFLKSYKLKTIKKQSIRVKTAEDAITQLSFLGKGDRCKIAIEMERKALLNWEEDAAEIRKHADAGGIIIKSLEPIVIQRMEKPAAPLKRKTPKAILASYCEQNKVDEALARTGNKIVESLEKQ